MRINLDRIHIYMNISTTISALETDQFVKRIFQKDASLWKIDENHQKVINNRLGWLNTPQSFGEKMPELISFAHQIKSEDFSHVVLFGMGGSSLCSEVAKYTFGSAAGFPEMVVLDNTSPEAVKAVEQEIDLEKSLFIVASKSGGTVETISFYYYFFDLVRKSGKASPGDQFIAITDPETGLFKEATEKGFRKIFVNPPDIGGRYSVLSYFGLVPMALIGIDVQQLLQHAIDMMTHGSPGEAYNQNPGILAGAFVGAHAKHGRDKLTFLMNPKIESFGYWVEQLIAESTGKEGHGVIPIVGENIKDVKDYTKDRAFVIITLKGDKDNFDPGFIAELKSEGHPVFAIELDSKISLGGSFWMWEFATSVAGQLLGVNPFDEPNVAEAKKRSDEMLDEWRKGVEMKAQMPTTKAILNVIDSIRDGDYFSILSYVTKTERRHQILSRIREKIANQNRVVTTLDYGPRYLHSTGQLHKGGANNGVYLLITADENNELPIPRTDYDFETLHLAKGFGDLQSLVKKNRRVCGIHIEQDIESTLLRIEKMIDG